MKSIFNFIFSMFYPNKYEKSYFLKLSKLDLEDCLRLNSKITSMKVNDQKLELCIEEK